MYLCLVVIVICIGIFLAQYGSRALRRHRFLKAAPWWHGFLYDTSGWRHATSIDCQHLILNIGGVKYEIIASCPDDRDEPGYSLIVEGRGTKDEIQGPVASPYIADLFNHHVAATRV